MIVSPNLLPSSGKSKTSKDIEINPLNFIQVIDYSRKLANVTSDFQKFMIDYNLVKSTISNWKTISLMDLEFIIFLIKKNSVTKVREFTITKDCPSCNSSELIYINTDQLQMPVSIDTDLFGEITLNNKVYKFEVPNLEVFDSVISKVTRSNKVQELKAIYLIATLVDFKNSPNEIENVVLNAVQDDAADLFNLYNIYYNPKVEIPHKCSKCKRGQWSTSLRSLVDNVFLDLLLNHRTSTIKIGT